jgi:hypothetical protein
LIEEFDIMAALNQTVASKDAFAVLQRTIEAQVMEQLPRIVHSAIRKGVVAAAKGPAPAEANEATATAQEAVTRPVAGGLCAKVWDTLDSITKDKSGALPTLQEVQKLARRKRWNANTARVQYYRWRATQPAASAS